MFMERKLLFIAMLSLLGVSACTGNKFWQKIQSTFESGRESALIKEFTDFEWDTLCLLQPYAFDKRNRDERLKELVPADLGEFEKKIPNLDGDGAYAFVFIKENKVIAVERRGRGYGLSTRELTETCFPAERAMFKAHPTSKEYIVITDK